ncbi:ABC transporter permease [Lichenibacterium ramalinae]|uniref:Autoinducer 2 import system permease protein LsrD n=1 Tax=Lichenibacterium ramalinae TaxID=2316527 RepID=A0A4Q2R9V7_9HYPH|nr:ABC transporter permease [Lichenibacterium ramalinae]RYB02995.1 ABC transporter permease [Lichenibacterium ramalinae]
MTLEAASPARAAPEGAGPRTIPDRLVPPWRRFAASWEAMLLGVAATVFLIDALASPYFLDLWNLSDATFNFTEKAIIALAMAFVVMAGEIDLSVGGTVALASTAMGAAAAAGAGTPVLVLVGLGVGAACGLFNGLLVARLGLPSIMATVGTMSLYRGLSYVALGDGVYKDYPAGLAWFGQGYVWQMLSFEFASFLVLAVAAGVVLHRTTFGRAVRAIGNNAFAARFSGLRVERIKLLLFVATGLAAGLAAVMLTGRLGSTRPSIALGWELDVVTVVVLGGIDIQGGSGTVPGVVIAAIVLGLVTYGLGLLNVPGIIMSIVVGLMLIGTIALPILVRRALARRRTA